MGNLNTPSTGHQQTLTHSDFNVASSTSTLPEAELMSDGEAAKLMRKIDLHVLPMLFLIYLAAFLDR